MSYKQNSGKPLVELPTGVSEEWQPGVVATSGPDGLGPEDVSRPKLFEDTLYVKWFCMLDKSISRTM